MKTSQLVTDKLAIGLSLACAIHCLGLPLLLVLVPTMSVLPLDNEAFHLWMFAVVLPSSIYALSMGCRQHKQHRLLLFGSIGLTLLVLALILGEDGAGVAGEKVLTVVGAGFVAVGHWLNFRLCHESSHTNCDCPNN